MGLIRKALSVGSVGVVGYRSKGERKVKVLEADSKANIAAKKESLEIERRRVAAEERAAAAHPLVSIATRLDQLNGLLTARFIDADEHAARKTQILAEI